MPIDEALKKEYEAYQALIGEETNYVSHVCAQDEDGYPVVNFIFIEDFQFASIIYSPDGNPYPFMSADIVEPWEENWCIYIHTHWSY